MFKSMHTNYYQHREEYLYLFMTNASHRTFLFSALLNVYTNEILSFFRKSQELKKFFHLIDIVGTYYTKGITRLVVKDCILF